MMEWQVVMGILDAHLLSADLQDRPWPSVLVSQMLPDGTEAHAKWSYRARDRMARVVTIYYPE